MAREVMLDIGEKLAEGAPSVFNAVAHYRIEKKGPLHLMEGYRHIFAEGSLSRTISIMGHFMLRVDGSLGPQSVLHFPVHHGAGHEEEYVQGHAQMETNMDSGLG